MLRITYHSHQDLCLVLLQRVMYHREKVGNYMDGARIKSRRRELGLSAEKIAKVLGTTRVMVGRWEKGKHEPDDQTKIALAKILQTSVAFLIGETDDPVVHKSESPQREIAQDDEVAQSHLGLAYWAQIVDNAREVALRKDMEEVAEIEHMLKLALRALESVKVQSEVVCQPTSLEKPYDAGAKSA